MKRAGLTRWGCGLLLVLGATLTAHAGDAGPLPGYEVLPWPPASPAPPLVATGFDGKIWRLADLRGKAVLVNFWASWCEPCRAEMPSLQQLARQHGGTLVVLAVNFKESSATVQQFVQRTGLSLPVLPDPQGQVARQWGVRIFPSTVLIGADGRVRSVVRGELNWTGADALQLLRPLLPVAPVSHPASQ